MISDLVFRYNYFIKFYSTRVSDFTSSGDVKWILKVFWRRRKIRNVSWATVYEMIKRNYQIWKLFWTYLFPHCNQKGNITTLDGASLKLVVKFTYLGSSVSSTEKDIDTRQTKAWTAVDRLSIIWKSNLTDKMKRSFFQAAVVSILLYGCTTWTLTKRLEKKLDGNYTRMLRAILNKSWRQHPTRHQLYGHLSPITKTIQVRRTRHAGYC